eukprot:scaffold34630_cov185-Amphora_coffeaeformis.AAC.16
MANPYLLTSIGAAAAISFSCLGSAMASCVAASYAMALKGWASHVPIIISGVLGIYGLVVGAALVSKLRNSANHDDAMGELEGYANLAGGLAVGLPCYASGMALAGFLSDSLYREDEYYDLDGDNHSANTPKLYRSLLPSAAVTTTTTTAASGPQNRRLKNPRPVTVKFVMMLVFLEALGLYGLIVALLLIG